MRVSLVKMTKVVQENDSLSTGITVVLSSNSVKNTYIL